MIKDNRYKKLFSINILIILTLSLFGFALLYFLFYSKRNQQEIYARVVVVRPKDLVMYEAPYNWIPYWISNSIQIGDKENNLLGGVAITVLDKEAYEGKFYGELVYLLLKLRVVKDRSGIYLYKNRPLSTGGLIDLKLTNSQFQGLVTYLGTEPPKYKYAKITLTTKNRGIEPWMAEILKVGSEIKNNKGETIAKLVDKKITFAEVRSDTSSGQSLISYDKTRRDVETKIEIQAKKVEGQYYFSETQKINVAETLYLPWKEEYFYHLISSIDRVNDVSE